MRRLLPALLFTGFALIPSAKADLFIYDVQEIDRGTVELHVRFELPTFEQAVLDETTFDIATWTVFSGSPTHFSISGGSEGCDTGNGHTFSPGPCYIASNASNAILWDGVGAPAFSVPGTFTKTFNGFTNTVTITDVATVPEPSALVLLASALLAVGLVVWKRRRALTNAPSFAWPQGRALS